MLEGAGGAGCTGVSRASTWGMVGGRVILTPTPSSRVSLLHPWGAGGRMVMTCVVAPAEVVEGGGVEGGGGEGVGVEGGGLLGGEALSSTESVVEAVACSSRSLKGVSEPVEVGVAVALRLSSHCSFLLLSLALEAGPRRRGRR